MSGQPVDLHTIEPFMSTLHKHYMPTPHNSEWIVDSRCTHYMANDASLFSSLSEVAEYQIDVASDYALTVAGISDVKCLYRRISNVYHVPGLSANICQYLNLPKLVRLFHFGQIGFLLRSRGMGCCMLLKDF